ncbi:MAG: hypothetical protein OSB33_07050, partial [Candidatus Poseidoniales archaeon]|nr:hypothetical protein [Candidatus Poseidoniales archaeon]
AGEDPKDAKSKVLSMKEFQEKNMHPLFWSIQYNHRSRQSVDYKRQRIGSLVESAPCRLWCWLHVHALLSR